MKCPKCGFEYNYDSNLCPNCGNVVANPVDTLNSFDVTQPVNTLNSFDVTRPVNINNQTGISQNTDNNNSDKKKSPLLFIIAGIIIAIIVIVVILIINNNKDDTDKNTTTTETVKATEETEKSTEETKITEKKTEDTTEAPVTEAPVVTDTGNSFHIDGQLLVVDESLFGMTYDELNIYLNNTLPRLIDWEWSDVPLNYCDYVYTDGKTYTLFFENNKLIGIRSELVIDGDIISEDIYNQAVVKFGEPAGYWANEETNKVYEIDWTSVSSNISEYAIFINVYDDINHVNQQYTSPTYSGNSIQPR